MRRMLSLLLAIGCCCGPLAQQAFAAAGQCNAWPEWATFRDHFVEQGRVIDPSSPRRYTTSEGQSYALFFALVANDRENFDRILEWTEKNLADGSLAEHLPAWEWGRRDDGQWGVLDSNSAADSDLWIAYALGEAGILWNNPNYSSLAAKLAARILADETADLPELGLALLPGATGFRIGPGEWRLNPSYVPLQLVRRMARLYPKSNWRQLIPTSLDLIVRSAPRGLAPDWIRYVAGSGFQPDHHTDAVGSFNAIRVYLWAGMLPGDDPIRALLTKRFSPMTQYVIKEGVPPLESWTVEGEAHGVGPAGFSAALLPFLAASGSEQAVELQRARIAAMKPGARTDNYYEQVLTLFGLGYADDRFRFRLNGSLTVNWKCD